MRLKNKSVNLVPSIGNLPANLSSQMTQILTAQFTQAGLPAEQAAAKAEAAATAVLANQTVQKTMLGLKNQFDTELDEAIGEYEDGKKIAADIPAYLSVGVGYSPIDPLRINVGFHFFDDKNAKAYNNRQEKLDHGTLEYNAGVEYDINKKFTVSAGWQSPNYGLPEEEATTSKDKRFMDDKSFVTSSNSVGLGGVWHFNKKMSFTVAYFHTFYQHKKTTESVELIPGNAINYSADYSRNNNVFAAGIDINF